MDLEGRGCCSAEQREDSGAPSRSSWPARAPCSSSAPGRAIISTSWRSLLPGVTDRHLTIVADLAKPGAAEELVERAGDIDGLVANAAPAGHRPGWRASARRRRSERCEVNFESPILMARALGPEAGREGRGPPRLHRLTGRQGRLAAILSLQRDQSSGCAASPSGCVRTCTRTALAFRSFSPGFVREAGMFRDARSKPPPGPGHDDSRQGGGRRRGGDSQ